MIPESWGGQGRQDGEGIEGGGDSRIRLAIQGSEGIREAKPRKGVRRRVGPRLARVGPQAGRVGPPESDPQTPGIDSQTPGIGPLAYGTYAPVGAV